MGPIGDLGGLGSVRSQALLACLGPISLRGILTYMALCPAYGMALWPAYGRPFWGHQKGNHLAGVSWTPTR